MLPMYDLIQILNNLLLLLITCNEKSKELRVCLRLYTSCTKIDRLHGY